VAINGAPTIASAAMVIVCLFLSACGMDKLNEIKELLAYNPAKDLQLSPNDYLETTRGVTKTISAILYLGDSNERME
jgi:hypothetical protein